MSRRDWIVVAVALAVAAGGGAWFAGRPVPPPPVVTAPVVTGPGTLTIHVSGAVHRPGLVHISPGGRMADAIAAAGGALPGADLDAVNLAAPVRDGDQVHVPVAGDDEGGTAAATPGGPVRLNRATAAELEELPGIGPVTAGRIVAHRETHGPFLTVEDLLDVPGIGEGKLAALRDAVVVP